jgi:hypothetical protein
MFYCPCSYPESANDPIANLTNHQHVQGLLRMASISKLILGIVDKLKNMSDENGQEIDVNAYDENDEDELIEDEEAAVLQPAGVVREEIVTVTKDSDTENNDSEHELYEEVKAHSDQISRLTYVVESLQSQIKLMDQRRRSGNKTSSVRKNRSTTKIKENKTTAKKPKRKRSNKRR